jgi:hypothetical protein
VTLFHAPPCPHELFVEREFDLRVGQLRIVLCLMLPPPDKKGVCGVSSLLITHVQNPEFRKNHTANGSC